MYGAGFGAGPPPPDPAGRKRIVCGSGASTPVLVFIAYRSQNPFGLAIPGPRWSSVSTSACGIAMLRLPPLVTVHVADPAMSPATPEPQSATAPVSNPPLGPAVAGLTHTAIGPANENKLLLLVPRVNVPPRLASRKTVLGPVMTFVRQALAKGRHTVCPTRARGAKAARARSKSANQLRVTI